MNSLKKRQNVKLLRNVSLKNAIMLICEYQFQSYGYGHGKFWQLLIESLGIGSTTQHYCLTSVFCI